MAQDLPAPVNVTKAGSDRRTTISTTNMNVGQVVRTGRVGPRPRPFAPGMTIPEVGPIATDNTPASPDANVDIGDKGVAGGLTLRDRDDRPVISLNGLSGTVTLGTGRGAAGQLVLRSNQNGPVVMANGKDGRITFLDARLNRTMVIDGVLGDIQLIGADCAEDFDVAIEAEPGSVMCAGDDNRLHPCLEEYDTRVVGVVSGAGGLRPALRLDRGAGDPGRQPLALAGKVFCLVDADRHPVRVGDLLTTSSTEGHAMRATSSDRSFGAVLGKSLAALTSGRALIPVLVSLQ
jgi:hypothetical protein